MTLSVVVLAKNEEKNIGNCLKSLTFCDEMIVIDDNSQDETINIAKQFKAKIFTHSLDNNFANQRNFGLQKAQSEWVLFLDADEIVSDTLAAEILDLKSKTPDVDGFYVRRIDSIWGRKLNYGETGNIKFLRLAKKDAGRWQGKVHEKWEIDGKVGQLNNPIIHYPHQNVAQFLIDINFYTSLRAQELNSRKVNVHWWSIIFYPKLKFFVNYFLKRGFLDGIPGFIVATFMSFHSFLVRGKLWLMQKNS